MGKIRFGVIGCGVIHSLHCDAIKASDSAELSAVYDVKLGRAEKAAQTYGCAVARSLEELWPMVDAVTLCIPSGLHGKIGTLAAQAGKHVLTEKPVDVFLEPALAMIDACEKAGVKHGCISQHRTSADIIRLREAAQVGELGKLLHGDSLTKWYRSQEYYDSGDWRGTRELDGGCLMNQSVHYIDMIQWVMGGVDSVQAVVKTAGHDIEVEDDALAIVHYKNGAMGLIQGSTVCYPGFGERLEVHGQHGSVILEADQVKVWQVDEKAASAGAYGLGRSGRPEGVATTGVPTQPGEDWGAQHARQIEDFIQAIKKDRDPMVTCRDALEPLKIILSIYKSSRLGGALVKV